MKFSGLPVLNTKRLQLRPLTIADTPRVYQAIDFSRQHFIPWLLWADAATEHSVVENLRRAEETMALGTAWHYAILTHENELVGRISLEEISPTNLSGELGYWLRQDHENQGRMTEAARAFVRAAFASERLHRIFASVDTENIGSRRVLTTIGFQLEGTHRHVVRHPSLGWRDHQIYAQLVDEVQS